MPVDATHEKGQKKIYGMVLEFRVADYKKSIIPTEQNH